MRREQNQGRGKQFVWAGVLLCVLAATAAFAAHAAYHAKNAETTIPNDCFVQTSAAATGESAAKETAKIVCLTFDDGPSKNTEGILQILAREQVPATFFVCAQDVNTKYLPLVKDIAAADHQIALHSASHEYKKIYQSTDAFWQDIKTLRESLGQYISTEDIHWLRFPGGSTNTVSHKYGGSGIMKRLKTQAEEKGYRWIDWNVCAEDATAAHPDAAQIVSNIKRDAEGKSTCVVLMHDTKATGQTVKALPDIIAYFRAGGYTFCTVQQMYELQNAAQ